MLGYEKTVKVSQRKIESFEKYEFITPDYS